MNQAAVGFQCPDCVRAGAASIRTATTVAGGALIAKPRVTYVVIGINLAAFLLQLAVGINTLAIDYGMWPFGIAIDDQWWRLVTSAFLHGSILHIAFNMYVLFVLGPPLERILGHARFLLLYLVAALGGSVTSYAFSDIRTVSVGASGAIFGLMGALIVAGRRLRTDIRQVAVLLGINVVIGFIAPGVDWRAHLGGLVVGAAMAAILVYTPQLFRSRRSLWQVSGTVVVLLMLVVVTAWRTGQIADYVAPLGIT
ncbi:MAG: rhomboid family intramembrane serine protease [Actinomycetes bacterium]|jgi:membrane associated rhomboid family serine protease|nr:rhomboid family intramembrane serine protease [Candidatus Nanopelagicales bacterium]MDP4825394.1 rhomboid family intramembrane serine protease [Candidatus Nanopelagicales bacterium]MDP4887606.1 rhomboid family intramembrane serine protease [Candidatus Nanopelagicales bacterium]